MRESQSRPFTASFCQKLTAMPVDNDYAFLVRVVQAPWAEIVTASDPRFKNHIELKENNVKQMAKWVMAHLHTQVGQNMLSELKRIVEKVLAISKIPIEQALMEIVAAADKTDDPLRHRAIGARLGFNVEKPVTLKGAGEMQGVTKERMRQQTLAIENAIGKQNLYLPQLDALIAQLEGCAPVGLCEATRMLKASLLTKCLGPHSVISAAKHLNRCPSIVLQKTQRGSLLVKASELSMVDDILKEGVKLARDWGVVSVRKVQESLLRECKLAEVKLIERAIWGCPSLVFLANGWFKSVGVSTKRNRLVNALRKMLVVCQPQTIDSLHAGFERYISLRKASSPENSILQTPPIDIMQKYIAEQKEFAIENDMVRLRESLTPSDVLSNTELTLYEVLCNAPGRVLDREKFEQECLNRGMKETTFSAYVSYSPIIEHSRRNHWHLRGMEVSESAEFRLDQELNRRPRSRRVIEHGWKIEGYAYIVIIMPSAMRQSMIVTIPSPTKAYLLGRRFQAFGKDNGLDYGTVSVNHSGLCRGFNLYVQAHDLQSKDRLIVEFDILNGKAILSCERA